MNRYGTFLNLKVTRSPIISELSVLLEDEIKKSNSDVFIEIRKNLKAKPSKNIREESGSFSLSDQEIQWFTRNPKNKWIEYVAYRYKFKSYPKRQNLTPFPLHVLIEPTSMCNLRCVMCFQVDKSFTKPEFMGHMPWELFVKVANQLEGKCPAVTLASRGEPTLHPMFRLMMFHLWTLKILDLKINTNATRLTETTCHDILSAGVNEVVFSVDAGTKETYEKIRVGGKFHEVVSNIERFNRIREKDYPKSKCVTRISGVKVNDTQDLKQMAKFWTTRVDQVTIKSATPRWDSYNNKPIKVDHPCGMLWERMYVWYDGKVNPCDFDYKSYLCVGDAKENTLQDIWLGEKYTKLREEHLNNQRNKINPCDRCPI